MTSEEELDRLYAQILGLDQHTFKRERLQEEVGEIPSFDRKMSSLVDSEKYELYRSDSSGPVIYSKRGFHQYLDLNGLEQYRFVDEIFDKLKEEGQISRLDLIPDAMDRFEADTSRNFEVLGEAFEAFSKMDEVERDGDQLIYSEREDATSAEAAGQGL